MSDHLHTGLDAVIFVTLSAIIGFHVIRFVASKAAQQDGWVGEIGKATGGLVTFGGA